MRSAEPREGSRGIAITTSEGILTNMGKSEAAELAPNSQMIIIKMLKAVGFPIRNSG
jgi:hypothetical protein